MSRTVLNTLLLVSLLAVVAFTWGVRRDFDQRNSQFLPGMADHVAFQAMSENPNFADGGTLRDPIHGTVGQGFPPLHFAPASDDAARAGRELVNPVPDSVTAALERGGGVFVTFCQPCHGAGADGDGVMGKRGFPPPPSLLADKARQLRDGQMFHIITHGQGNMPSLASQIVRDDRWKVITYVRSIQRAQSRGNMQ